jgi:integrase/recombinase XerD
MDPSGHGMLDSKNVTGIAGVGRQFHFEGAPMLHSLFPRDHHKFLSLPLLGPIADSFDDWLAANGYTQLSRMRAICDLPHVDAQLRRRQIKEIPKLTLAVLDECWRSLIKKHPHRAGTVRPLERYLVTKGLIVPSRPAAATSRVSILIDEYANSLREVRGLAASTIAYRRYAARCFLQHLEREGIRLKKLQAVQIESYIRKAGKRLCRAGLQLEISALRGFLRFLATDGRAPEGLASQIDTPRLYRLEKLPRSLPWETVRALLRSIDRSSPKGLRDYAMFLLMATYGLRSSEVIALTLDDLRWKQGSLEIHQQKTAQPLELPLTNAVSCALAKHVKRTPPPPRYRRIFLRMHAPIGVLNSSAVNAAFRHQVQKSGLHIPFQGPHCLRHSLAVRLLQKGTPLKTISDILGHRSTQSTATYLRLATEDLREVPLPVPVGQQAKERQR